MFLSASLNTLLILLISTDVFVRISFENKTNSDEMLRRVGPWLRVAHTSRSSQRPPPAHTLTQVTQLTLTSGKFQIKKNGKRCIHAQVIELGEKPILVE